MLAMTVLDRATMTEQLSAMRFPAQYLEIFESFARVRGIDPEEFRAALRLPGGHTGHRGNAVDGEQFLRLMRFARHHADPDLPLAAQLLEHTPLTALGTLGIVVLTSSDLHAALDAVLRFYPLVMPACEIERQEHGEFLHLVIHLRLDFGDLQEPLTEMLLGAFGTIRHHVRSGQPLLELHFRHAARHPPETYGKIIDPSALCFGQPCNRVVVPRAHLDLPLHTSSRATRHQLEQQLEAEIVLLGPPGGFTRRVREWLQGQLEQGRVPNIEALAASLNLSSRTLGRHLAREGQTFKALVNEVRLDHADYLLRNSRKSVRQIARAAGFTNDSSFARSFRRRKGVSPSQLRHRDCNT